MDTKEIFVVGSQDHIGFGIIVIVNVMLDCHPGLDNFNDI
jgi:hypothetical protein